MAQADMKQQLSKAFLNGDIEAVCHLAPNEADYHDCDVEPVLVAMTLVSDMLKRRKDEFLNEAISLMTYIHSCYPDLCAKQYIDILVNLKAKAFLHNFLKLGPGDVNNEVLTSLLCVYFDPNLFQDVPDVNDSPTVVYSDEESYSAKMHKLAYQGLIDNTSGESVEQLRKRDFTDSHDKLVNSLEFYLNWIKKEFKQGLAAKKVIPPARLEDSQEVFNLVLPDNPLQHTLSQPFIPETQTQTSLTQSQSTSNKPPPVFFYESDNSDMEENNSQTLSKAVNSTDSDRTVVEEDFLYPHTQIIDVGSNCDVMAFSPVDILPSASQMDHCSNPDFTLPKAKQRPKKGKGAKARKKQDNSSPDSESDNSRSSAAALPSGLESTLEVLANLSAVNPREPAKKKKSAKKKNSNEPTKRGRPRRDSNEPAKRGRPRRDSNEPAKTARPRRNSNESIKTARPRRNSNEPAKTGKPRRKPRKQPEGTASTSGRPQHSKQIMSPQIPFHRPQTRASNPISSENDTDGAHSIVSNSSPDSFINVSRKVFLALKKLS